VQLAPTITTFFSGTPQAWIGPLLIAIFWPLNWLLPDATLRTAYLFFPLWLGYALTVDALVLFRRGTSILSRSRPAFFHLFIVSAPAWWIFELINRRTRNWEYVGTDSFTDLEYFVLCTIAFSTVMPAVFGTAELVRSFPWTERFASGPRIGNSRALPTKLFLIGALLFALVMLWPDYFYPLVWISLVFLIEPLNLTLGRQSLFTRLNQGDWRPFISLSAGALICGFFWELWNHYSYPQWVYHTPGAQFLHLFQMPLLGYLGYIPFAWELLSLRQLFLPQESRLNL
jgi:hypothetical protein